MTEPARERVLRHAIAVSAARLDDRVTVVEFAELVRILIEAAHAQGVEDNLDELAASNRPSRPAVAPGRETAPPATVVGAADDEPDPDDDDPDEDRSSAAAAGGERSPPPPKKRGGPRGKLSAEAKQEILWRYETETEGGTKRPPPGLVADLAEAYGVTGSAIYALLALAKTARSS